MAVDWFVSRSNMAADEFSTESFLHLKKNLIMNEKQQEKGSSVVYITHTVYSYLDN